MAVTTATPRTYVTSKVPDPVGIIRVVAPEGTLVMVSERLDAQEQQAARVIAAYLGQPEEGHVNPAVVVREDRIIKAVSEATGPMQPFPVQP